MAEGNPGRHVHKDPALMTLETQATPWDFSPAIELLRTLSVSTRAPAPWSSFDSHNTLINEAPDKSTTLGNFSKVFDYLQEERAKKSVKQNHKQDGNLQRQYTNGESIEEKLYLNAVSRDEDLGVYLGVENAIETPSKTSYVQKRVSRKKRQKLERRAVAREATKDNSDASIGEDSGTGLDSADDLKKLRRSPDRTAVIRSILGPLPGKAQTGSPPTSPSPPKSTTVAILKRERPVSDPFHARTGAKASFKQPQILPVDGLDAKQRRLKLIALLCRDFSEQSRTLLNEGILDSSFLPQNVSTSGIHVFIDISNIMIGFHDCLKIARGIPVSERVRRIPMSFHHFSLVLERGRPAARRVLAGSDRYSAIDEAKLLGYELNILERVHKAKQPTPRQKRFRNDLTTTGASSGSETNQRTPAPEKWVEQAVDEILHLKILESIIDAEKPATIVLATGDAAEAEYSAGFMKMVERALLKGWMVELVSFKLNTSGLYKRKEFRSRWGPRFKWIQLDEYVEQLLEQA
ncbi:MAG: hypothetical protein Q9160_004082 [Pyrenula sp. 1 TL-2023]